MSNNKINKEITMKRMKTLFEKKKMKGVPTILNWRET
jgi:hypothetical protein